MSNVTDAGRHLAEAVNLASIVGGAGKWVAARISDGKTDGNVYDTKGDALKHARINLRILHETQCVYVKIPIGGMPDKEATDYIAVNRKLYEGGMRIIDPDREVIMPYTNEEFNMFMRSK